MVEKLKQVAMVWSKEAQKKEMPLIRGSWKGSLEDKTLDEVLREWLRLHHVKTGGHVSQVEKSQVGGIVCQDGDA
jgi:hypothetical protein